MTWEARNSERDPNAWDVYDGETPVLRGFWSRDGCEAKLAAAAPDLLEALREVLKQDHEAGPGDYGLTVALEDKIEAAITKAEGR